MHSAVVKQSYRAYGQLAPAPKLLTGRLACGLGTLRLHLLYPRLALCHQLLNLLLHSTGERSIVRW